MLLSFLISIFFQIKVKKYLKANLSSNLSGFEIAVKMLNDYNIHDVKVVFTEGDLSDHYNPSKKTVNLSKKVYYGISPASAAIASHECGHALQHSDNYFFMKFRFFLVPFVSISSKFMHIFIFLGILLINQTTIPLKISIFLFLFIILFHFITLPIEFDASKKALIWMNNKKIINLKENLIIKKVLFLASLTYVISTLSSLAYLLNIVSVLLSNND